MSVNIYFKFSCIQKPRFFPIIQYQGWHFWCWKKHDIDSYNFNKFFYHLFLLTFSCFIDFLNMIKINNLEWLLNIASSYVVEDDRNFLDLSGGLTQAKYMRKHIPSEYSYNLHFLISIKSEPCICKGISSPSGICILKIYLQSTWAFACFIMEFTKWKSGKRLENVKLRNQKFYDYSKSHDG